jgi:hypothetical protein
MITIKQNNPTPKSMMLSNVPVGELFRFKGRSGVYLKLHWDGEDYLRLYSYAHDGINSMLEDTQTFTANLYVWNAEDEDELDIEYYEDKADELRPYYDFDSKCIMFSAFNEEVELLNGELTVSLV